MRICQLLVIVVTGALTALSAPAPSGRILKVPKDAYETATPPRSWWLTHTNDYSDEWKTHKLDLRNTKLYLHALKSGMPLGEGTRVAVSSSGEFILPELKEKEYLLEIEHVAYKFNPVLIVIDEEEASFFRIEAHKGVRHIGNYMPSLTIRPERFDCPYPTPEGLNPIKYLKNPMVIMLLLSGFIGIILPKLMDSEAMAEVRQEQGGDGEACPGLCSLRELYAGAEFVSPFFQRVKAISAR